MKIGGKTEKTRINYHGTLNRVYDGLHQQKSGEWQAFLPVSEKHAKHVGIAQYLVTKKYIRYLTSRIFKDEKTAAMVYDIFGKYVYQDDCNCSFKQIDDLSAEVLKKTFFTELKKKQRVC